MSSPSGPEFAHSSSRSPRCRLRGEFFSLGGLLAPFATTRLTLAPWAFSAAVLASLAMWDPVARGGRADAILIGLAFYELLIGLTRDGGVARDRRDTLDRDTALAVARRPRPPSRA